MKLAVISDIHLTEEVEEDALNCLDETLDEIDSENPDLLVVLGDMIGGAVTTGKEAEKETEGWFSREH